MRCVPRVLASVRRDCRGNTAIWFAIAAPTLFAAASIGVEASFWSLARSELQSMADAAALAGAMSYAADSNVQNAALAAAYIAEVNGGSGATTRSWNASNQVLSDGSIITSVGTGITNTGNIAVTATIRRAVPVTIAKLINRTQAKVITATATSETYGPSRSAQPCIVGLDVAKPGVTTQVDVMLQGNTTVTLNGCSMRSNANISFSGNPTVSASAGFFAAGTIASNGSTSVTGPQTQNAGTIADPYASNTAMQTALAALNTVSVLSVNDTPGSRTALMPGVWSSWNIKGTVVLSPGLYVVTGAITINAQASISGTGVTIVSAGAISTNGGATLNFTAPGITPQLGAVPGIIYASTTNAAITFGGNASSSLTGVH